MNDTSKDNFIIETADWSKLPASPLVSVHMLAYRHEKFIAQAIDGVIAQRCSFPIELVIAEDCSPDATLEIARTYQARFPQLVRVVTGPHNVGMHKNAQRGMTLCRGKYIAICEGDDFWHNPDKLQMQVDLMKSNPSMVLCHTDFDRMTRFRTKRSVHRRKTSTIYPAKGNAYESLLLDWSVMTATSLYRHDILSDFTHTPFYTHEWPFGDRNLLLYTSLRGTVGYIDRSTATFRKMRGSAGNSGFRATLSTAIANGECIQRFLDHYPVAPDVLRKVHAALKQRLYGPAYFEGRIDLMQTSFNWLQANGFAPSQLKHCVAMSSVRLRFPLTLHRWIQEMITNQLSAIAP